MRDLHASVWSRAGGDPEPLGRLVVTDGAVRFSYVDTTPGPELSLLLPREALRDRPWLFARTEAATLPPRFLNLIPPADPANYYRQFLARKLAARPDPPPPGFETEWAMLLLCGRNGLGHLDVFADDREAEAWYARTASPVEISVDGDVGAAVRRAVLGTLDADDPGAAPVDGFLGSTASLHGMMPKFAASIPANGWDGRLRPPRRGAEGEAGWTDVVIKCEPEAYRGIVALEALAYQVHDGIEPAPRRWAVELGGGPALVVERFDRGADGRPIPLESFYSLFAIASRTASATAGAYEDAARLLRLRTAGIAPCRDPEAACLGVFRRVLLALLTGNGDLHFENLSLLGPREAELSPVYDPAPMRAWARHDMLTAVPFAGVPAAQGTMPADLGARVRRLGRALGLRRGVIDDALAQCLDATREYADRVAALVAVPETHRRRLVDAASAARRFIAGPRHGPAPG